MTTTIRNCRCARRACDCCDSCDALTPSSIENRPGLDALRYRVGTHGRFLLTMKARLGAVTVEGQDSDGQTQPASRPLESLTTRAADDPTIALLDAWANVADVLTFYQERIANEGYLRTCTEPRSVVELAKLVGYAPRPGVAATVYLAYTVDPNQKEAVLIPAGARVQSVPGPGETPQSFETSEDLRARPAWNRLGVRLKRPQKITSANSDTVDRIYLKGTSTQLRPGDKLVLAFLNTTPHVRTVARVELQAAEERTLVALAPLPSSRTTLDVGETNATTDPSRFVAALLTAPRPQVANALQLRRDLRASFAKGADAAPQLLTEWAPRLKDSYYRAWSGANLNESPAQLEGIYALRVRCSLFGATAPKLPAFFDDEDDEAHAGGEIKPLNCWNDDWRYRSDEVDTNCFLDHANQAIAVGSYVFADGPDNGVRRQRLLKVKAASVTPRTAYGLSGPSTELQFEGDNWRQTDDHDDGDNRKLTIEDLRETQLYLQSERIELADEPLEGQPLGDAVVELDGLYGELTSGRWVIVSGERNDIEGVRGVYASELAMLALVQHGFDADLPNDSVHTTLIFAKPLAYSYYRDTVTICANVVKATHGETRQEVLGSGDGATALQSFTLRQAPLTFVAAPTPEGVESTLRVEVHDVAWREVDSLAGRGARERCFVTTTDEEGHVTVAFGDGRNGSRLPTGVLNVTATYRSGIGAAGNVRASQITQLQTRPLGVREVVNPLRASGGADREGRDLVRESAPLSVIPLDRLVSVRDYADFTRHFAGIAKAVARRVSDGKRQMVYITIAGVDDAPIDPSSDLYGYLAMALRRFGDPDLPVHVEVRERVTLVLSANVKISPEHRWEPVATAIRARLLEEFGFAKRSLGQPALRCEIICAIQSVPGVVYVDIDAFGGVPEKKSDGAGARVLLSQQEIGEQVRGIVGAPASSDAARKAGRASQPSTQGAGDRVDAFAGGFERGALRPAQLAIFAPGVPDTLILNPIQ